VRAWNVVVLLFATCRVSSSQPLDRTVPTPGSTPIIEDLNLLRRRLETDLTGLAAAQLLLSGRDGFGKLIDGFRVGGATARRAAVWAAGVSDDPRAPQVVAAGLADRDYRVIDQARRAVWARPTRYVAAAAQQLRSTPYDRQWALLDVLSKGGEAGAQALAREFRGARGPARKQVASAMLDSPNLRDRFAPMLIRDANPMVRRDAYEKLLQSPTKAHRELWWQGLRDRDVTIRRLVSESFRRFIAPSAVDKMRSAARDSDAKVRINAAWGLGNLSYLDYAMEAAPKGLAGLFAMLDDADPQVLTTVADRIAHFGSPETRRVIALKEQEFPGSPALTQLRALLVRTDIRERLHQIMVDAAEPQAAGSAARALACLGDRRALPSLLVQLDKLDLSDAFSLAAGFAVLGDLSATEPLLAKIRTVTPYIGGALISAFEGIPDPAAVPPLVAILRDSREDFQRRSAAGRALATMPDASAHAAVIAFVQDVSQDSMLRGNVLYGLAWIQSPETYAALVEALSEPSMASARWQAISVLGLRGEPQALPLIEPYLSDPNETVRSAAKTAVERLRRIAKARPGRAGP